MCRLHPVFNVVKLTATSPDPIPGRHLQPPPPLEVIDGKDEYLVEKILDSKMFCGRLKFKIKWEGYGQFSILSSQLFSIHCKGTFGCRFFGLNIHILPWLFYAYA